MKQLLTIILGLILTTSVFAQEKEVRIYKYNFSSDDNEQVKIVCEVEDGICRIVVKDNGNTSEYKFNLSELEDMEETIKDVMEKEGIDFHQKLTYILNSDDIPDMDKHFMMMGISQGTWLGIYLQPLTEQLRDYFRVKDGKGVLISEVVEDSPADEAGLKAGDVIIAVGDEDIEGQDDVVEAIREREEGEEVEIVVVRKGRKKTLTAELTARERDMPKELFMMKPGMEKQHKMMMKMMPPFGKHHNNMKGDLEELRKEMEELKMEMEKLKKK
jgi:C-terminal processing protease CtpA/Prc